MIGKLIGAMAFAGAVSLSSCGSDVRDRAQRYAEETGKTQKELINIKEPGFRAHQSDLYTDVQSKLDSTAYYDVFKSTQAVKDSSKVAEFNKIAQKGRLSEANNSIEKLIETGVSAKEFKKIKDEAPAVIRNDNAYFEYYQYKTDSINYKKFFDKHNLLDKKAAKLFNKVSKMIKP